MKTGADPGRRRRFVIAAVVLPVAVLALAEGALRVGGLGRQSGVPEIRFIHPDWVEAGRPGAAFRSDPDVFWRLTPGARSPGATEPMARSGYRTEFDVAKPAGASRIVCLGDSNTFGFDVTREAAWPAVLGSGFGMLPADRTWEVISLGVPGYTSWQVRRLLETEVAAMSPDVVTIEVGAFNEWLPAIGMTDRDQGRRSSPAGLRVVEIIAQALRPAVSESDLERLRAFKSSEFQGLRRVPVADFEDDLRAIAAWCGEHRVRAVFIAHPLPASTVATSPIALEYADAVRRAAAQPGSALVDGWESFRASGHRDDELFVDFCHPSPIGHRVLAQAVSRAVRELR